MADDVTIDLTTSGEEVRAIADAVRDSRLFALDLEFVSEGRYIPELALVQVAWGDPDAPQLAAIDPLATDPMPLFEVVKSPDVAVIAHAAKQDLALLQARYQLRAQSLWDTQIGAAFAGLGEQVGYGRFVSRLLGVDIDKGSQFTDWARRPLSAAQIRYAIDDVRHLLAAWPLLRAQLVDLGRLDWVREESERLTASAGDRPAPEEIYRQIGGWAGLDSKPLGSLRALAEWREREALATNTPPSWILPDAAMMDLSKRMPSDPRDLRRARGVGPGTVRRYGEAIVDAIRRGGSHPVRADSRGRPTMPARQQAWSSILAALITARCEQHQLPARFVGGRTEAEQLILHSERGGDESSITLLSGWRRQFVGDEALAWLRGEIALAIDRNSDAGIASFPAARSDK